MDSSLPESDWKIVRRLHDQALERFCQKVLSDIERINAVLTQKAHTRYLEIFKLVEEQDKEIEWIFNDLRRSNAMEHLCAMYSRKLLPEEDFALLSQETQDQVRGFLADPLC
ncbi:MAG: hypothetical protein P4L36_09890 [Holophaga sp.]|nr:hypothetical protein [Holophaga sp.]